MGEPTVRFVPYEYRWGGDYLQRLLRTWQGVADNRGKIDPAVYQILDAFARGVNCFIKEHRKQIPDWIDEVTAVDIEALERCNYLRFYTVDSALSKLPGGRHFYKNLGSNQWAVEPEKSANGRIIHVENVHMPWANHFQNYEAQLITPGRLNVAGISWFGSPFFLVGFNEKVTWSVTWNDPNIGDVYEERINPANPGQYFYDGHWREIRTDPASFRVKEPDGTSKTVTRPMSYTHHGPIVGFEKEQHRAYSVKLPNFDGVNYSTGLYSLMKAATVGEFKAALARQLIPRWNFLCTTAKDVYWVHTGIVARRDAQFDWSKPVPGWLKETEWGPYLPFASNPQLLNPPSGFVQNCNNPPWLATRDSGLKSRDPVPYYLGHPVKPTLDLYYGLVNAFGWRADEGLLNPRGERVFEILTQPNKKFTLQEMMSMGFDTYVLAADVIVPLLEQAAVSFQPIRDVRLTRAISCLRSWNRYSSPDSVAFTYLFYWARAYQDLYFRQKFKRFDSYQRRRIDIRSGLEQGDAWHALEEAVDRIEKTFGKLEIPWGEISVVNRGRQFPLGGTDMFDVLHPDGGPEQPNGQIDCNDGWGHFMIVMESDPKQIWSLLPYGESEHPDSPHYNDQARLHSQKKPKPFWFRRSDILANTESTCGDPKRLSRVPPESAP